MHNKYINKSRVYTVSSANVQNQYLSVNGSKVSTNGTATYLYTVSGTSGNYSLGSLATATLSTSAKYAIVIYYKGLYYSVTRDANEINSISYNGALPTSVSDNEVWSVEGSTGNYHFYQTIDNVKNYIRIAGDGALGLDTAYGNSKFVYTYTAGNTNSGTYANSQSNPGYKFNLFKVSKPI